MVRFILVMLGICMAGVSVAIYGEVLNWLFIAGIIVMAAGVVLWFVFGRCPDCNMPIHSMLIVQKNCPYCGHRLVR